MYLYSYIQLSLPVVPAEDSAQIGFWCEIGPGHFCSGAAVDPKPGKPPDFRSVIDPHLKNVAD